MKYEQIVDGQWVRPAKRYRIRCCDCALIHDLVFRVKRGSIEFRARRNARATATARRRRAA